MLDIANTGQTYTLCCVFDRSFGGKLDNVMRSNLDAFTYTLICLLTFYVVRTIYIKSWCESKYIGVC